MNAGKLFVKGLLFVLPIALTFVILSWLFTLLTPWVKPIIETLVPDALHFSGMEYLASAIMILMIGGLVHWRLSNVAMDWLERVLSSMPMISVIYNNLREIVDFVSGNREQNVERVVLASINDSVKVIGLVTKPAGSTSLKQNPNLVAVYIPMSYQMGGFLTYLTEDKLETLDLSTSDAMHLCLTADISTVSPVKN